ncbi:MAG TPA: hypothetical protein VHS06_04205 [Chloroflexota bacterium]|nr:hypothetical protein [Chloroflexota bacterium]
MTERPDPFSRRISRSQFLKYTVGLGAAMLSASLLPPPVAVAAALPPLPRPEGLHHALSHNPLPFGHEEFIAGLRRWEEANQEPAGFAADFRQLLLDTARRCVADQGAWINPGINYPEFFFCRDSFWLLAGLNDIHLSTVTVKRFREDQMLNADGHAATAFYLDGSSPQWRDRDDESTLFYILHNYLLFRLGGEIGIPSMEAAHRFVAAHVREGRYLTTGETRSFSEDGVPDERGAYHYWLDTLRIGTGEGSPEVIAYNQGLLCVALRALKSMGIALGEGELERAEAAYAGMVNPEDECSIPQREGARLMDVSSLVGEALSLYLFDRPILSRERVEATFQRLNRCARVDYPDGAFLGYKVLCEADGKYLDSGQFLCSTFNSPGRYQNGGSWLLYDGLALYAAARHGVEGAAELFAQRLRSEVRSERSSHEFLSTNPSHSGPNRPEELGYGWNAFLVNLLP